MICLLFLQLLLSFVNDDDDDDNAVVAVAAVVVTVNAVVTPLLDVVYVDDTSADTDFTIQI